MLDDETKKPHINDTVETRTFLRTMVELSNQCRKEERTLYAKEVHGMFAKMNIECLKSEFPELLDGIDDKFKEII